MTRDEVKKLIATIATVWPNFHKPGRPETPEEEKARKASVVNAWHFALEDFDANYIAAGLKKLMQENTFPPAIAEVVEAACQIEALQKEQLWQQQVMDSLHHRLALREQQAQIKENT